MKHGILINLKGSAEAAAFYMKALDLKINPDMVDMNDDGTYKHISLVSGDTEIIAISEDVLNIYDDKTANGKPPMAVVGIWDISKEAVDQAYAVLSEGARHNENINGPGVPDWDDEGECYGFGLVDKYGVSWRIIKL